MGTTPELKKSVPRLNTMAYFSGDHKVERMCLRKLSVLEDNLDTQGNEVYCKCGEQAYLMLVFSSRERCECCDAEDFLIYRACKKSPLFDKWVNNKNVAWCILRDLFHKHSYELI